MKSGLLPLFLFIGGELRMVDHMSHSITPMMIALIPGQRHFQIRDFGV